MLLQPTFLLQIDIFMLMYAWREMVLLFSFFRASFFISKCHKEKRC